jgi:hypothetical protein
VILSALNLPHEATNFPPVTASEIADFRITFHAQCIDMLTTSLRTNLRMYSSNGSLVTAIKLTCGSHFDVLHPAKLIKVKAKVILCHEVEWKYSSTILNLGTRCR